MQRDYPDIKLVWWLILNVVEVLVASGVKDGVLELFQLSPLSTVGVPACPPIHHHRPCQFRKLTMMI
jgi:hypothetical protein